MNERAKHTLLLVLIALTTVPFFFLVHLPTWGLDLRSRQSIALYLSAAFGYGGVSLLIWELILGTRAISGLYFKELASKLKLHRWLGTYGILFIFLHPFLVLYNYGESLGYVFVPTIRSDFDLAVTYGRVAFIGLIIVWVTSAIVRGKIAYRPWKYIHYLSYPILLFSLLHVPSTGSSFPERGIQFFWLSFCAIVLVCTTLRLAQFFGYGKVAYKIVENARLAENIALVHLSPVGEVIEIRNGQYLYIQSRTFGEEHPFTVLDYGLPDGGILIAFKIFGRFTEGLANLPVGDVLMLDGPYGTFTQERSLDPTLAAVYIAGGIGITPFVRQVLTSPGSDQYLFWANQSRDVMVFRDQLRQGLGARFIEVYSRENLTGENLETGHINKQLLAKYLEEPSRFQYFICGPQGMMGATKASLLELGVSESRIQTEEFGF